MHTEFGSLPLQCEQLSFCPLVFEVSSATIYIRSALGEAVGDYYTISLAGSSWPFQDDSPPNNNSQQLKSCYPTGTLAPRRTIDHSLPPGSFSLPSLPHPCQVSVLNECRRPSAPRLSGNFPGRAVFWCGRTIYETAVSCIPSSAAFRCNASSSRSVRLFSK